MLADLIDRFGYLKYGLALLLVHFAQMIIWLGGIGVDRDPIPKKLWMTADFVVAESLRGFERGKLIVVPGWRYKIIVGFMRMMPAGLMLRISAGASQKYRREKH